MSLHSNSTKHPSLVVAFIRYILSCYGLIFFNIAFLIVLVFSLMDMATMLLNVLEDTIELEKLLDGIGTLFVAYGVALEEREFLMTILGLYPQHKTSQETYIDHISHHYGVLLLIIGLVIEVAVQLIKIPDRFIDIVSFELPIFTIGFLCLLLIGYWLIIFCYKLANNERLSSSYEKKSLYSVQQ